MEKGKAMIEELVTKQKKFMKLLGIEETPEGEEYLHNPQFKAAIDGVVTEAAEVLSAASTLTKPWKAKPVEEVRAEVLEELTDVMFMVLEVYIMANVSPDAITKMYDEKLAKNLSRLIASGKNVEEASVWLEELNAI